MIYKVQYIQRFILATKATVEFVLKRNDLKDDFMEYLKEIVK
ncbi:hypothetical protein [Senegalia massiliensis]|nr:hypothetical protein [Senegalia massiliensis]